MPPRLQTFMSALTQSDTVSYISYVVIKLCQGQEIVNTEVEANEWVTAIARTILRIVNRKPESE